MKTNIYIFIYFFLHIFETVIFERQDVSIRPGLLPHSRRGHACRSNSAVEPFAACCFQLRCIQGKVFIYSLYLPLLGRLGRKKRALIVTLILQTLTIPTCRHMQCRLTHLRNNLQVDVPDFPVFGFNTVLFTNVQTVLSKVERNARGGGGIW